MKLNQIPYPMCMTLHSSKVFPCALMVNIINMDLIIQWSCGYVLIIIIRNNSHYIILMLCLYIKIILNFLNLKTYFSFKVTMVTLLLGRFFTDLFLYHFMILFRFFIATYLIFRLFSNTFHPMISFVILLFHYCLMFSCSMMTLFTFIMMNLSLNKGVKLMQLFFFTSF